MLVICFNFRKVPLWYTLAIFICIKIPCTVIFFEKQFLHGKTVVQGVSKIVAPLKLFEIFSRSLFVMGTTRGKINSI